MKRLLFAGTVFICTTLAWGQDWKAVLDEAPPTTGGGQALSGAYLKRAEAARMLGDPNRELAELESGVKLVGPDLGGMPIRFRLFQYHIDRGASAKAVATMEDALKVAQANRHRGLEHAALAQIATGRSSLYDMQGSGAALKQMLAVQEMLKASPAWGQFGAVFQARSAWATGIRAGTAGDVAEAEASFSACLTSIMQYYGGQPRPADPNAYLVPDCAMKLAYAQMSQGKLADAGAVVAQYRPFIDSIAAATQRPLTFARQAPVLARIAVEQGRVGEARAILEDAMNRLREAQGPENSFWLSKLRSGAGQIEMLEGNWEKADALFRERRASVGKDADPLVMGRGYTLVRLGRPKEAVELFRPAIARLKELFDDHSAILWMHRAFYGIALAAAGERETALAELSIAVPKVLEIAHGERSSADSGAARAKFIGWILDGYIGLLSDIHRLGGVRPGLDPMNEAFRMADLARGSTVQRALAASASRASVSDPALAQLVRAEQDAQREISSLSDAIGNLLARGRLTEQDKIIADMRANLVKMRASQQQILRDLQKRYPDYANLIDPKPLGIADVQKALRPNEALVSIYVGSDRTLVWAIPAKGAPAFAVASVKETEIAATVKRLREALDPKGAGVPNYDFAAAHDLYSKLLAPVESGWASAQELILVPHAALGSLPFATLTTAPFSPRTDGTMFAGYGDAPWLVKKVAISQLPAALALTALRGRGQSGQAPRAFLGFGDPIFSGSGTQVADAGTRGVARRNLTLAAVKEVKPDSRPDLALLSALPDTSQEISDIAQALKADASRDLFLQKRATESNVKAQDMSGYRVVMFATHGLVPGEMPGLYTPALALSNPEVTGEKEDGFLTMEEILALKLRADWVVLSACNTASPSGEGSEAVSGLGRAFFYAGAKALLVSSWPVETVSARLLTTDVFRRQVDNPKASRAGALRDASLNIMKQGTSGYSYAHPLFWAPFVIVGDGG